MTKVTKIFLLLAALVGFSAPAAAQMGSFASEGDKFLDDVRAFNAPEAMGALRRPGNNLVDYRDRTGEAALHIAVKGRKLTWVDALAGFNADLDIRNADGDTPLHLAVRTGQFDVASRLLDYGASADLANRRGETPAILAVLGRQAAILEALLKKGADPDKSDSVAGLSARDYATRDTRNPKLLELIRSTRVQDEFEFGPILR